MKKQLSTFVLAYIFSLSAFSAQAEVSLPAHISSGMVLQRNTEVKLWGKANPSSTLSIRPSWSEESFEIQSKEDGSWSFSIPTLEAGGPYSIELNDGGIPIVIQDILFGDVYFASGQSNMEYPLSKAEGVDLEKMKDSNIRVFNVRENFLDEPTEELSGHWSDNLAAAAGTSSALSALFAYESYELNKVPIGIINAAEGGTPQESWLSQQALEGVEFKGGKLKKYHPSTCYNGMVAPVAPYTIKAVLWYQGEANTWRHAAYANVLDRFVRSWREDFENPKLPFLICQIAGYSPLNPGGWIEVQLQQASAPSSIKELYTAANIDLGVSDDVHPKSKSELARRLALLAQRYIYNDPTVIAEAPRVVSLKTKGSSIEVVFDSVGEGLTTLDAQNKQVNNFELAGEDGRFIAADAYIINKNTVSVTSSMITKPLYLRYCCHSFNANINLYNSNKIPAMPYKSDSFAWIWKW